MKTSDKKEEEKKPSKRAILRNYPFGDQENPMPRFGF